MRLASTTVTTKNKKTPYKFYVLGHRGYLTFSVLDRFLFHRMNTKSGIFTSGGVATEKLLEITFRQTDLKKFAKKECLRGTSAT